MQKRMLKDCRIGLFLGALLFSLVGCADKKDSSASCMNQLNAEQYQSVAENTNCSNYERASGYLGLAGMSFSNFMKKGASDNLTKTLEITSLDNASDFTSGNRKYFTNALCLIGSDNITSSDRCINNSIKRSDSRPNKCKDKEGECELSMFANIGDLLYTTFSVLDNNSDGTISGSEITPNDTSAFDSDGGASELVLDSKYEMTISGTTYVADNTSCVQYSDNFTDNISGGLAYCANIYGLNVSDVSEVKPIIRLDNLTDYVGPMDLDKVLGTVNEISLTSKRLDIDFDDIGIDNESEIRKELTKNISKFDNGGKAKNNTNCTALTQLNAVFLLVKNPADNNTSSLDLLSKNIVSFSELASSIDSGLADDISTPIPGFPSITEVRLIYKKNNGSYSDSYEAAHSYLYNSLKNLNKISSSENSANDGSITFQELICYPEN